MAYILLFIFGMLLGIICLRYLLTSSGDSSMSATTDATFMTAEGHPLTWRVADFPLKCYYVPNVPASHVEATQAAMRFMNEAIGIDVFNLDCACWYSKPPESAFWGTLFLRYQTVTATRYAETRIRYLRLGYHIWSADVVYSHNMPMNVLQNVALHEIGHVLGLEHDEYSWSIMQKYASDGQRRLTVNDKQALRKAYAPRK